MIIENPQEPFCEDPIIDMSFEPILVDYRNFEGGYEPSIGVYCLIRGSFGKGICREYKVDWENFMLRDIERVYPVSDEGYFFESERGLIRQFNGMRIQGIRTQACEGMSMKDLCKHIAESHAYSFFNSVKEMKEKLEMWKRKGIELLGDD